MELNWGLLLPFIVIQFILTVIALIDLVPRKQVNGPKWLWIVIVLLINTIGPILYFVIGRKEHV